ncbi:unnamed protein product [Effrenium voratum]|uniref:AMP deaminase n=1 Tax=Effrenium voratum TaxID=2562239 RepID=A0AA36I1M9_9DINO|nr:unnamed protein product [Effrenium voratum]
MTDMSREEICSQLRQALELRRKYCAPLQKQSSFPSSSGLELNWKDGLMQVCEKSSETPLLQVPSLDEYYSDMTQLFQIRSSGPVSSYAYQRLRLLQTKFELYTMVFGDQESQDAMDTGHRDFYNVRKVDTHIHHSAAMNAKHLLRFMKKKLKRFPEDIIDEKNGEKRTLQKTFDDMGIGWTDLCIDRLQVWADKSCLHRFDRFNNKYSPLGQNELRTIFLKTDNAVGGRYLAELTKELICDLEESKYQHAEWRLSIYGRKKSEWDNLSKWVLGRAGKGTDKALLSPNIMWMIQIPRLFALYKSTNQLNNFGEMLENIFTPIFEATLFPEKYPDVAEFLQHISGFDTVDDESRSERPVDRTFSSKSRAPPEWDIADNPSYKYYSYFIQSNLRLLNMLRHQKGLNTFAYRPHAGEAGEVHHLDTAFLLADGVNHGLNLRKSMGLQYLFYLAQIGLAMSPCSNNQLFLAYEKSPFPVYFARGLNVSLSTDDPLMFHQTKEPLMEEYSIAKQIWHFTSVDLCEIARNSVLQSGFPDEIKASWFGTTDFVDENKPPSTNVPNLRIAYRRRTYKEEMSLLEGCADAAGDVGAMCNLLLLSPSKRLEESELPSFGLDSPRMRPYPASLPVPGEENALEDLGSLLDSSVQQGGQADLGEQVDWAVQRNNHGGSCTSMSKMACEAILEGQTSRKKSSELISHKGTAALPNEQSGLMTEKAKDELLNRITAEIRHTQPSRDSFSAVGLAAFLGSVGGFAAAWFMQHQ